MPRGASKKREREYEKLKKRFQKEGRYKGRQDEVAARIVNKQRRAYGETKGQKKQRSQGEAPDRHLPIDDYEQLTVKQIKQRLPRLDRKDIDKVKRYEEQHKGRRNLLQELDRHRIPIRHYERMKVGEIRDRIDGLSKRELEALRDYERQHKDRKRVLAAIAEQMK